DAVEDLSLALQPMRRLQEIDQLDDGVALGLGSEVGGYRLGGKQLGERHGPVPRPAIRVRTMACNLRTTPIEVKAFHPRAALGDRDHVAPTTSERRYASKIRRSEFRKSHIEAERGVVPSSALRGSVRCRS